MKIPPEKKLFAEHKKNTMNDRKHSVIYKIPFKRWWKIVSGDRNNHQITVKITDTVGNYHQKMVQNNR